MEKRWHCEFDGTLKLNKQASRLYFMSRQNRMSSEWNALRWCSSSRNNTTNTQTYSHTRGCRTISRPLGNAKFSLVILHRFSLQITNLQTLTVHSVHIQTLKSCCCFLSTELNTHGNIPVINHFDSKTPAPNLSQLMTFI